VIPGGAGIPAPAPSVPDRSTENGATAPFFVSALAWHGSCSTPRAKLTRGKLMIDQPDPLLGIHAQALGLWQRRAEVISSNLANADTPGFLARDLDFRKAMTAASGTSDGPGLQMTATEAGHIGGNPAFAATDADKLAYRVQTQPTMDGNTVDTQVEQAQFAANAIHYQASLSFITSSIHAMRMAISGSSS
jgi:flagellar basal-body rod protein FlgB